MSRMSTIPFFDRPMNGPPTGGWSMAPGYAGPLFPNSGPFHVAGNNMGGWNYSVENPALGAIAATAQKNQLLAQQQVQGPAVSPWFPPGAQPAAPTAPGNGLKAPADGLVHARGASGAAAPVVPQVATDLSGTSGQFLNPGVHNVVDQIVNSPYQPVQAPDLGITDPAQKNLINYQQWLWNQANSNNDTRFRQAASLISGQGTSALADINTDTQNQKAQVSQDMIDRGLNNSTVGAAMNMGVDRNAQYNKQKVSEGQSQQLINLLQSRTDAAPDNNLFSQFLATAANKPNAQSLQLGQQPYNPAYGNLLGGGGGGGGNNWVTYTGQGIGPTLNFPQPINPMLQNQNTYYPGVWPTPNKQMSR